MSVHFKAMIREGYWVKIYVKSSPSDRFSYWHHGIISSISGDDISVIHFTSSKSDNKRVIRETNLDWFLQSGEIPEVVTDYEPSYEFNEIVKRARSHIGKGEYDLPTRNCEHFASWCYTGKAFSEQVFSFGSAMVVLSVGVGTIGALIGGLIMLGARRSW